jgi:hypothetical protein
METEYKILMKKIDSLINNNKKNPFAPFDFSLFFNYILEITFDLKKIQFEKTFKNSDINIILAKLEYIKEEIKHLQELMLLEKRRWANTYNEEITIKNDELYKKALEELLNKITSLNFSNYTGLKKPEE